MKKLYKRTATGAVQVWWQEIDGPRYRTHSGQQGGEITVSNWTYTEQKNVGKRNETTAEEQAVAEVASNYRKKLAQGGYKEDANDIDTASFIKPMLAHKFGDYPVQYPVYVQPKLDGVRCIASKDGLFSRAGKEITSCPHIWDAVKPLVESGLALDGELYTNKHKDNFNEIISAVRKQEYTHKAQDIEYWIYDVVDTAANFNKRYATLKNQTISPPLVLVPTYICTDMEQINHYFAKFTEEGYEGLMVRNMGVYEQKRSKNLLKKKDFQDEEFEVLAIEEGEGNRAGMAGKVLCRTKDKNFFSAGIKGGEDFYIELLANANLYIGGKVTVRYFHKTPAGIPRFPVAVAFYPKKRDI